MSHFRLARRPLLAAVLFAFFVILGITWIVVGSRTKENADDSQIEALVVSKPVRHGTCMDEPQQSFETKRFPANEVPVGALNSLDQVKGKYLKRNLRKGEFPTAKDFSAVALRLKPPAGMLVVRLNVELPGYGNGFYPTPGMWCDLVVFTSADEKKDCVLLAKRVLVLAIDYSVFMSGKIQAPVTLGVHEESLEGTCSFQFRGLPSLVMCADDE